MTTARTFVRFALAGLLVNFLAVACVVSDSGDEDNESPACDPGSFIVCSCTDGSEGTRKCNASGSGYGSCVDCEGTGSGGEGGGPTAGAGGTNVGGGDGGAAGEGGAGLAGGAGASGGAGEGGAGASGGAGGVAGEGGAGGSDATDVCVEDPTDECQSCAQVGCCAEWTACFNETEGDCVQQFFNIMACARGGQASADVTTADLETCAADEVADVDAWPTGLLPSTKPLIDCVAGPGWASAGMFGSNSCEALCFLQSE